MSRIKHILKSREAVSIRHFQLGLIAEMEGVSWQEQEAVP